MDDLSDQDEVIASFMTRKSLAFESSELWTQYWTCRHTWHRVHSHPFIRLRTRKFTGYSVLILSQEVNGENLRLQPIGNAVQSFIEIEGNKRRTERNGCKRIYRNPN